MKASEKLMGRNLWKDKAETGKELERICEINGKEILKKARNGIQWSLEEKPKKNRRRN